MEWREKTTGATSTFATHNRRAVGAALTCLRKTTPGLNLSYPADAWRHFDEVHAALRPWLQGTPGFRRHGAAGFGGPWIENVWISHFGALGAQARARGRPLRSIFGPYVPLFVPFTDHWVRAGYRYPSGLVPALLGVLRRDILYITVSQNDAGLSGQDELPMALVPNVLVLSAGGYGHIPVPLLKQLEPLHRASPMATRPLLVSYVGSLDSAPRGLRTHMRDALIATSAKRRHPFAYAVTQGLPARWSVAMRLLPSMVEGALCRLLGVIHWRRVMADSHASLCPRGWGRSSYHLAETVQMGRVPIYVYSDVPWVPYERLFRQRLGYVTDLAGLPMLLTRLADAANASSPPRGEIGGEIAAAAESARDLARRERTAARLRGSHFTLGGVMQQIQSWMLDPARSDLQCQRLPSTIRDA